MSTPVNFLFIMDPQHTLNLETETSLLMMEELIKRGHGVYWLEQEDLALVHDQPEGLVFPVTGTEPLERAEPYWSKLNRFDAVVVRKDPPFGIDYLQLTLILDYLEPGITQFNDVWALRNFNEKMLPLLWPDFTPPTLISMNIDHLERFCAEHRSVVLKPLNDCSGRGVLRVDGDENRDCRKLISGALINSNGKQRFLVAQKYLQAVSQGDKRVYLVNGEPVGMVNRVPQHDSFLANIHQGARCASTQLSPRENHIVRTIAPRLLAHGIVLAGVDFIDGYLTEVNITSPSAVRQINQVSGGQVHHKIVDTMLKIASTKPCCSRNAVSRFNLRCCQRDSCCADWRNLAA